MFKFAVIGCGSIGRRHIQNLLKMGESTIVAYDVDMERRREVEQKFGICTVDQLDKCWDQAPDVAFITSPTSSHMVLAIEAARHGCHLFIEKPLSHNLSGIDELMKIVREQRLTSLIGCNMRFHPGLRTVQSLLKSDAIGRVIAARVEVGYYLPDWHPSEDYRKNYSARRDLGGGIILDAIHELDYVRWLLGEIERVSCFADKVSRLEINTEDIAAILLRFRSGAIASVHLDYVQRAYSRSCQIIGEEGTIRWDFADQNVRWYTVSKREWQVCHLPTQWDVNDMYLAEMHHFLGCLSGKELPEVDVVEAAAVLRVAAAARESAETGRAIQVTS
jgi:predicted dehydrogenase